MNIILKWICFILFFMRTGQASTLFPSPCVNSSISTPDVQIAWQAFCRYNPSQPFCSHVALAAMPNSEQCRPLPPRKNQAAEIKNLKLDQLLLDGATKMIAAGEAGRRAIFVLGNTGAGKTTATQIMAGDLGRLYATTTKGGSMVIIDDDDRIGAPTTKSSTITPQYVVHPETGVAFWDCPGFDDNRGPILDMATMYFLTYALNRTSSAKFLFVVNYSSVKAGNDRNDFDLLVTHASRLLKNVTRFTDSIALLVNKVGSFSPTTRHRRGDDEILLEITDFIKTYGETKREELNATTEHSEGTELANKIDFIDGILGGEEMPKSRLFFLRTPESCGSLELSESVLDTRKKITDLYSEDLNYTVITGYDFGITLRAETILQTQTLFIPKHIARMNENIRWVSDSLGNGFLDGFYKGLESSPEESLERIINSLEIHFNSSFASNNSDIDFQSVKLISAQVQQLFQIFDSNLDCDKVISLRELEAQLRFFDMLTTQQVGASSVHLYWSQRKAAFLDQVERIGLFYYFCTEVEASLVTLETQVRLANIISHNDDTFEQEEVLQFLDEEMLFPVQPPILTLWEKMSIKDKEYLVNVVRGAFPQITTKCEVSNHQDESKFRAVISGRNVRVEDALNFIRYGCHKEFVNELSIVAMERVYFDADLDFEGKQLHLTIIAPLWIIANDRGLDRKISLDGTQPLNLSDAGIGVGYGDRGGNGVSGKPGSNAGSFYGLYMTIDRAEKLLISANGGDGGNGQNGGNGQVGRDGADATIDDFPNPYVLPKAGTLDGYYENGELKERMVVAVVYNHKWFSHNGKWGNPGGDGGTGGDGGPPGGGGTIDLLCVQSNISQASAVVRTANSHGKWGAPGLGGEGGVGGRNGTNHSCMLFTYFPAVMHWGNCETDYWRTRTGRHGRRGKDGKKRRESVGISSTSSTHVTNTDSLNWRTINAYRTDFFGQQSPVAKTFSNELNSNLQILSLAETLAFAEELEALEKKYFLQKGTNKFDMYRVYYEGLMDRLDKYIESQTYPIYMISISSDSNKVALNIIYITVLGKLAGLRRAGGRVNVIKTKDYFDSLLLQLRNLQTANKQTVIQQERDTFKANLDKKMKQVEDLVKNTVQPAINDAFSIMENANVALLEETNEFITAAETNVQNQKKLKSEYEAARIRNIAFGVLNIAGTAASFLGPVGALVGQGISTGVSMARSLSPSGVPLRPLKIPDSFINSFSTQNVAYYKKKIEVAEKKAAILMEAKKELEMGNNSPDADSKVETTMTAVQTLKGSLDSPDGNIDDCRLLWRKSTWRIEHRSTWRMP